MRTVGVILILSACLLIDRAYKERVFRAALVLSELSELFRHLDLSLSFKMQPVSSLVSGIELPILENTGLLPGLRSGSVPSAVYNSVRKNLGLSCEIDGVLADFFNYSGKGTGEDMRDGCRRVLSILSEEYKRAEENARVKARLMRVVLLSLGLGLAITVI